jgi:hypothetical protein
MVSLQPLLDGATARELMAIFGWTDIKEAEIYARGESKKARCKMRFL